MSVTAPRMVTLLTSIPLGLPPTPANLGSLGELQSEAGSSMQTESSAIIELEGSAQHAIVTSQRIISILTSVGSS